MPNSHDLERPIEKQAEALRCVGLQFDSLHGVWDEVRNGGEKIFSTLNTWIEDGKADALYKRWDALAHETADLLDAVSHTIEDRKKAP